eukprot:3499469-Pyramimonas_sp.AAC.1
MSSRFRARRRANAWEGMFGESNFRPPPEPHPSRSFPRRRRTIAFPTLTSAAATTPLTNSTTTFPPGARKRNCSARELAPLSLFAC